MLTFRQSPICVAIFICLALLCAAPARAQEKVRLRLNLQAGQSYDQVIAVQQKVSQTFEGRRVDVASSTRFEIHNEVLESHNDTLKIKTTYSSLRFESQTVGQGSHVQIVQYDSTRPDAQVEPSSQVFAAMVGQSLVSTISSRGEVLKVEGLEAMVQRIIDSLKLPAQVKTNLSKTLNENLKKNLQSQTEQTTGLTVFPDAPVAIGDSWETRKSQSTAAPIFIVTRTTLTSLENGIATLSLRSKIDGNPEASAIQVGDTTSKYNLSGTQSGVMRVAANTGLPQSFELHQRFAGRVFVSDSKTKKTTTSFPLYIKSTVRGWTIAPPR